MHLEVATSSLFTTCFVSPSVILFQPSENKSSIQYVFGAPLPHLCLYVSVSLCLSVSVSLPLYLFARTTVSDVCFASKTCRTVTQAISSRTDELTHNVQGTQVISYRLAVARRLFRQWQPLPPTPTPPNSGTRGDAHGCVCVCVGGGGGGGGVRTQPI